MLMIVKCGFWHASRLLLLFQHRLCFVMHEACAVDAIVIVTAAFVCAWLYILITSESSSSITTICAFILVYFSVS